MCVDTVMASENAVINVGPEMSVKVQNVCQSNNEPYIILQCLYLFQSYLNAFSECANSPYGAVLVGGRLVAATTKWWQLEGVELVLLAQLVESLTPCASRDIAVFLPVTSPKVKYCNILEDYLFI